MAVDLKIRPLGREDNNEWRQLWTAYLDFYGVTLAEEVYETSFERLLADASGEYQGLVAELDGKLVGLAHFLFHRFMWSVEDTCYLMDLFCAPEHRGSGVGRALIEAVHAEAATAGIPTTYWMTEEHNYPGRKLYDKVAKKTALIVYEKEE